MVNPWSLGALHEAALCEATRFLHGQVTELLQRARQGAEQAPVVPVGQLGVLDAPLVERPVDLAVLAGYEGWLRQQRGELADYVDGVAEPESADRRLLERVAALRGLLELAFGQHVTFRGEQRPATGSPLPGGAPAAVGGYVATVMASGSGAVAVGRDIHGDVHTQVINQ